MKQSRSRPTPGPRAAVSLRAAALAAATLLLGACNYGFGGGGGFPPGIRTVCIEPFENQTDRSELTNEVFTQLNQKVPGALGLRPGDCKGGADATIRGKILRYDDSATNYSSNVNPATPTGPQQQTNQIMVTIGVQIIDNKKNLLLWDNSGVQGMGSYQPPNDAAGRRLAVDKLVQAIIDGAQSQW